MSKFRDHRGHVKGKEILHPDKRLLKACEALRHYVEHPNETSDILLQGGIYRQKDPEAIQVVRVDGVEVGYKVKPCSVLELDPYFDRYVYIKVPGYRLSDLTDMEMRAIHSAIMEAFLEPQQGQVKVRVLAEDAMLFAQRFMVVFPVARNPNLVSRIKGVDVGEGGIIIAS